MAKTYVEVLSGASSFLEANGKEGYAIEYLFLARKNWDKTQWLMNMRNDILPDDEAMIEKDIESLMKNIPPQYLLGYEYFFEHRLKVTEDTLIPRPETEELVAVILAENASDNLKVLDIGTGTGAISLSLAKAQPTWQVLASDISPDALALAQQNATKNAIANVGFTRSDVFSNVSGNYDIIVSNPPYIADFEKVDLAKNVLDYEPHLALFAEDNGLAIYQKIAENAQSYLTDKGKIYLEIGHLQGQAVSQLFQHHFPDKRVSVLQDLAGKDRMITID